MDLEGCSSIQDCTVNLIVQSKGCLFLTLSELLHRVVTGTALGLPLNKNWSHDIFLSLLPLHLLCMNSSSYASAKEETMQWQMPAFIIQTLQSISVFCMFLNIKVFISQGIGFIWSHKGDANAEFKQEWNGAFSWLCAPAMLRFSHPLKMWYNWLRRKNLQSILSS